VNRITSNSAIFVNKECVRIANFRLI